MSKFALDFHDVNRFDCELLINQWEYEFSIKFF